jgi:hypothetical protein
MSRRMIHGDIEDRVWLPAEAWTVAAGGPALSTSIGNVPAWRMDAAGTEAVSCMVQLPVGYVAGGQVSYEPQFTTTAPATPNDVIKFRIDFSRVVDGSDLSAGDTNGTNIIMVLPNTDVIYSILTLAEEATLALAIPATAVAGDHIKFEFRRLASHGEDTLPTDVWFIGLTLLLRRHAIQR